MPTVRNRNAYSPGVPDGNLSGSDEEPDGVKMMEVDKNEDNCSITSKNSQTSDKSSLKRSSTNSEDGSIGVLETVETLQGEVVSVPKQVPNEIDDVLFCFRILLVFNAALKSFAHGANDTANATGPFTAVLEIHDYGLDICSNNNRRSPLWAMIMAGAFVAIGIMALGHRVIKTVGQKLTVIDFHSGFCIELGSCVSVVLATQLGIPVSTTHCQIGAVIGAGLLKSRSDDESNIRWRKIAKIAITWVITVPFSGLLSVALMYALRPAFA